MHYHKLFIISLFPFLINSCKNTPPPAKEKSPTEPTEEKTQVEVMDLKNGIFYKEIVSNGKLNAIRKADLKFRVTEIIEKINVKNGDVIEKNAVLATLSNFTYMNKLQRARYAFEKSKLDMQDALLGQGFQTTDSTKVPPAIWKVSRIRSGYDNAVFDLQSAAYEYENTVLRAPFRGMICNLKSKENNLPATEGFCCLVDNSEFEAAFQVLESELRNIAVNQPVAIVPFAIDSVAQQGIVTEINPLVDENGLVTVKAKVSNALNRLYEGMNVRVLVRKPYPNRLVVPKQAVVLRTGKEVLFTCEDGRAKWHYVKTTDENTTSYVITGEDIKAGMQVIVSGNLNLGHDAEVNIIKRMKE
jgi:RND family efflux transporter MFP subunit